MDVRQAQNEATTTHVFQTGACWHDKKGTYEKWKLQSYRHYARREEVDQ